MSTPVDLEKLRSVGVSGAALPSRSPQVAQIEATERRWAKDFPAYRRLRKEGLRPRGSDGAARLEAEAETAAQVESRPDPKDVERVFDR